MVKYRRNPGNVERRGSKNEEKIIVSFEFLDIQQGQSFREWRAKDDLIKLVEKVADLNKQTLATALAKKIIIKYDTTEKTKWKDCNMPKTSKWKYPKTISVPNIQWSKIELGRKLRVIGYLKGIVFYVVFLDNNHEFYPTKA